MNSGKVFVTLRSLTFANQPQNYRIQMERVGVLINKLQQLYNEKADPAQLLLVIQQLQAELTAQPRTASTSKVVVLYPAVAQAVSNSESIDRTSSKEEKVIEVLQVDEAAITAELEELKKSAELKKQLSLHIQPRHEIFDPLEEVPTLAHQQNFREVNQAVGRDQESLNDKLKANTTEIAEKLKETPVRDLKKAIGINDRFVFISDLFRGDEAMYERSVKTINGFSILQEAEYWMQRELKLKLGWQDDDNTAQHFYQLVRRRFA